MLQARGNEPEGAALEAHVVARPGGERSSPSIGNQPQRPVVSGLALDVVFPVLHGPYGEDGTVQGLLELANVPYVGAGVLASAVGMDKAAMKLVFAASGLPLCDYEVVLKRDWQRDGRGVMHSDRRQAGLPGLREAGESRARASASRRPSTRPSCGRRCTWPPSSTARS